MIIRKGFIRDLEGHWHNLQRIKKFTVFSDDNKRKHEYKIFGLIGLVNCNREVNIILKEGFKSFEEGQKELDEFFNRFEDEI
jgi:hypothetical protein